MTCTNQEGFGLRNPSRVASKFAWEEGVLEFGTENHSLMKGVKCITIYTSSVREESLLLRKSTELGIISEVSTSHLISYLPGYSIYIKPLQSSSSEQLLAPCLHHRHLTFAGSH